MKWSDNMKLHEYKDFEEYLSHEGIYEIGHIRSDWFYPKYIGRSNNIYRRMSEYNRPSSCHNHLIYHRLFSEYKNLWFHIIRVKDPAWSESRLMLHHKIKDEGLYEFNKRRELVCTRRKRINNEND